MSWAEVKKINSDLSEPLDTKISAVETKVDTVDTVVDTINTNVGSDADSASASGSVHAKLKDIKNTGVATGNIETANYSGIPGLTTYVTLVNITSGGGFLHMIGAYADLGSITARVTIDGDATIFTLDSIQWVKGDYGSDLVGISCNIRAITSLKVELQKNDTNSLDAGVIYSI